MNKNDLSTWHKLPELNDENKDKEKICEPRKFTGTFTNERSEAWRRFYAEVKRKLLAGETEFLFINTGKLKNEN